MALQEDTYNTTNLTGSSYTVIYNRMEFKFAGTLVGVKVKTRTAGDYTLRIKSDDGVTTYQTHTIYGASAYSWITFDITELEVAIGEKYRMEVTRPSGKAYAGAVLYDGTLWKNNKAGFGGAEFDWTNAMGFLMLIYILVVSTQAVTDIRRITATGNGTIENVGLSEVSKRGICWNTTGNPTVADSKSEEEGSFDVGAFTRPMTDLTPGEHYYVKAYAYDSEGYSYGGQVEFDTPAVLDTLIATIPQYDGPSASRQVITRTSDGTLYAIRGIRGNSFLDERPNQVYKSTDNGWTWELDVEFAVWTYATNSFYRVAIAVDSNDKIHLAWASWHWDGYYSHGHLMYATKPKGGSWSAATTLTDYYPDGTTARQYYVSSMVIDGLNQVHIYYQAETGEHWWNDGSWHKENVFDGGFLVVDPNNTLYLTYSPYDHYAKKPLGGSWSTHAIPDFLSANCCCDKDGNLHFFNSTHYRKLSSSGVWGELEEYGFSGFGAHSISVTQDGIVHITGHRTNPFWLYYHCERSLLGVWSYTSLAYSSSYDGGGPCAPLLHAIFPVYGTYYPCLLEEGYAFVYKQHLYSLRFTADPEIPSPPAAVVSTNPASAVRQTTATLNGTLDLDGGEDCDCGFEWGETEAYGNTTPTQSRRTDEEFAQAITGLAPGTTYHFKAFATNSGGTAYGADETFTTLAVTTDPATGVGQTTATLNGTLDSDGGEACDCSFEYGETTDYGATTATQSKTTGETFSQEIRGFKGGSVYHFRAVATNSAGTNYGADRTFHTEALSAKAHQAMGRHFSMGRHGL